MKSLLGVAALWLFSFLSFGGLSAQETPLQIKEEESAEVFLEEYTDKFQEDFFEALKQKGIANYTPAINLLLGCKEMQPDLAAVDFELAKCYNLKRDPSRAQEYALAALKREPDNYWFLELFMDILLQEGIPLDQFENELPLSKNFFKKNLAKSYFIRGNLRAAESLMEQLPKDQDYLKLKEQIDALEKLRKNVAGKEEEIKKDPFKEAKEAVNAELAKQEYQSASELAEEAIISFPLQSFFYWAKAKALYELNENEPALAILEEGMDYISVSDPAMQKDYFSLMVEVLERLQRFEEAKEFKQKSPK